MKKALPPITWFRAFDATARHLSFTRAAQELGFTQSAISQNVRALEENLGTSLFVRHHRGLALTEAGRLLVPDVAAAMEQLEKATERFLPTTQRIKLSVATSVSVAQWIITPNLSTFTRAHPEIALQLSTTIWPDDFAATSADVEIRFGSEQVVGQDAELLQPSHLLAVVASNLPHAPRNLGEACLIQPVGISESWRTVSGGAQMPQALEASLFVDTHGLAVDLAVAGVGIALTHSLIALPALKSGRLVTLDLPDLPAREGYYLARNDSKNEEAQHAFVSWFRALL
ncbi:MAG: LysR family transcriptional regulator [Pseudomonadota bacterium]